VHIASNYRRCQRFLAGFSFEQETIGRLILHKTRSKSWS
jgi:hypothetical protein